MSTNRYGVDTSYFYNLFKRELTDLSNHTPDELARVLLRAARTADPKVFLEAEFQPKGATYVNALVKYNSGKGALLCSKCHVMIGTGFDHEDTTHYCGKCTTPTEELLNAFR
jgi:hypothetical protein